MDSVQILSACEERPINRDLLSSTARLITRLALFMTLPHLIPVLYQALQPLQILFLVLYLCIWLTLAGLSLRKKSAQPRLTLLLSSTLFALTAINSQLLTSEFTLSYLWMLLGAPALIFAAGLRGSVLLSATAYLALGLATGIAELNLILAAALQLSLLLMLNAVLNLTDSVRQLSDEHIYSSTACKAFKRGIAEVRMDDRTQISLDDQACHILGINAKDTQNAFEIDTLLPLLQEESRDRSVSTIKKILEQPQEELVSLPIKTFDGKFKWIRGAISHFIDATDTKHLLVVFEDATDQIERAEQLKKSAEIHDQLLEQLTLATHAADIRIIEENLSRNEAIYLARGKSARSRPPSMVERIGMVPHTYRARLETLYDTPGTTLDYPFINSQSHTGTLWLRQTIIRKYERAQEQFALVMVINVTEEKKFQQKLERSLKQVEDSLSRLDAITKAGQIGLFEWSKDSELIRPNQIFRKQTELADSDFPLVTTDTFSKLFENNEGAELMSQLRRAQIGEEPLEFNLKLRTNSGRIHWFRLIASAHESEEGDIRILGSMIDVSEHFELEYQLRKANEMLKRQSRTDPLTGLANRRRLDTYLETQYGIRRRDPDTDFSLVMIDIDYFKSFNDFYGHSEGDQCLKTVATILSDTIKRPTDLVARFGGEEFILVLPDTDEAGSRKLCRMIQNQLESLALPHKGSPLERLTLSFGISSLKPNEICLPLTMINTADSALYESKRQGRNRITTHKPVLD